MWHTDGWNRRTPARVIREREEEAAKRQREADGWNPRTPAQVIRERAEAAKRQREADQRARDRELASILADNARLSAGASASDAGWHRAFGDTPRASSPLTPLAPLTAEQAARVVFAARGMR